MKFILTIFLLAGLLLMTTLTTDNTINLDIVKKAASEAFPNNKILADLTVAQAILESRLYHGAKPSELALKYNNLFGIKARNNSEVNEENTHDSVLLSTHEVIHGTDEIQQAWFRKFNSIESCMLRRKELLLLDRYKNLWQVKDFWTAANLVRQDGYASDPNYSKELLDVYNRYIK